MTTVQIGLPELKKKKNIHNLKIYNVFCQIYFIFII